jgi:SRSO17 transposase
MDSYLDEQGQRNLETYLNHIGQILGNDGRRASFALYAMGLFGEGERKSVEPIVARTCPTPLDTERAQDRVLHFLVDARWSDREVRRAAACEAVGAMTERAPVESWIIDDTGFIKQGHHSVGVQHQYTGTVGKQANCQIGVSLSLSTRHEHAPVDFELYLPACWTEDPKRRREARIPDDIGFRTKPELALLMLQRAREDGFPPGMVLSDTAYGNSREFRRGVRALDLPYGVAIQGTTKVWQTDRLGRRRSDPIAVGELSLLLPEKKYRRVTWRDGTKQKLWSRFARLRVVPWHDDKTPEAEWEAEQWLVLEWERDEPAPTKFYFVTLPRAVSMKSLVRRIKERYRTERMYEEVKGELGLDHYEGRRYPGWHHHVSVVLCCYAFLVAERCRRFPPQVRRAKPPAPGPLRFAA